MSSEQDVALALARAVSVLVDSRKGSPHELLERLDGAGSRMNEAISEVDTIEELVSSLGEGLVDLIIEAGTQYVKKVGPLGLAEAALKGAGQVADFLNGGE